MIRRVAGAALLAVAGVLAPWRWTPQASRTASDLRGVCAPGGPVAWASGTKGTYLRTSDGGRTWTASRVPGAEELDFRDVEAFDGETALLLSAGDGARSRVYRTEDGGRGWILALQNRDEKGFFDALAFWDRRHGLVLGDPVDGRFVIWRTDDGGAHWSRVEGPAMPPALAAEGAFAASGTCLVTGPGDLAWFGTGGGGTARVFRSSDRGRTWAAAETPIGARTPSSGIFSLAFWDSLHGIAAGGDYKRPTGGASLARTEDGGLTWSTLPASSPPLNNFLSAVVVVPGTHPPLLVAGGTAVSAWSPDGGITWNTSPEGCNALAFAGVEDGWAVGPAGRVGRFPAEVAARFTR